ARVAFGECGFFFQAEDGIRDRNVTGVQTCALPIWTLAITNYGEMDVSIIDQLPAGRKPIQTKWLQSNQHAAAIHFLREQLKQGEIGRASCRERGERAEGGVEVETEMKYSDGERARS